MRLIDEHGQQAGIVPIREAIDAAREAGLDLLEVAPDSDPPVCRIMDWGKYRFEQKQRERDQRRKQRSTEVKGLRLRPTTDEGDFNVVRRKADTFLNEGHKVRVEVRFRGREITHQELGEQILMRLAETLGEVAVVEQRPSMEGRRMYLLLAPRPEVLARLEREEKEADRQRREAERKAFEEGRPLPDDDHDHDDDEFEEVDDDDLDDDDEDDDDDLDDDDADDDDDDDLDDEDESDDAADDEAE